jgi:hypothetical protein
MFVAGKMFSIHIMFILEFGLEAIWQPFTRN